MDVSKIQGPGEQGAELPRFTAIEAPELGECTGCMLDNETFAHCRRASAIAVEKGLPDCEDFGPAGRGYVYVLDKTDPRQIPLVDLRGEVVA